MSADDLVAALRVAGLRVTATRRAVCEVVAAHHEEHLTAGGVAGRLGGRVDQSTVYRTLDALEAAGVLTHAHLGHGPSVWHLAGDPPHHHLVCDRCGDAAEVPLADFEAAVAAITTTTGFTVDPGHFSLSGRCARCRRGEARV